jgi:hypothetical protein
MSSHPARQFVRESLKEYFGTTDRAGVEAKRLVWEQPKLARQPDRLETIGSSTQIDLIQQRT